MKTLRKLDDLTIILALMSSVSSSPTRFFSHSHTGEITWPLTQPDSWTIVPLPNLAMDPSNFCP